MLAKALGGEVTKCREEQIGFRNVSGPFTVLLTEEGKKDLIFSGVEKQEFNVFHFHTDTVVSHDAFFHLAKGSRCLSQAILAQGNAYGFQFHLELTKEMLDTWLSEDNPLSRGDKKEVLTDYELFGKEHEDRGRKIFKNFLNMLNT